MFNVMFYSAPRTKDARITEKYEAGLLCSNNNWTYKHSVIYNQVKLQNAGAGEMVQELKVLSALCLAHTDLYLAHNQQLTTNALF